jgi:uncharacterized protein YuzE
MERKITFIENNKNIEIIINYAARVIPTRDIDGGWGGRISAHTDEELNAEIRVNGDIFGRVNGRIGWFKDTDTAYFRMERGDEAIEALRQGAKVWCVVTTPDEWRKVITIRNVTATEIEQVVAELRAEVSEEVKALMAEEQERENAKCQEQAREILSCVDRTMAIFGHLPTTIKEINAWKEKYNNLHNEGGEGYIPEVVTEGNVKWAKKVLAQ